MRPSAALLLAAVLAMLCPGAAARGGTGTEAAPARPGAPPRYAVLTPAGAPEVAAAVREGWFFRWLLDDLEVRVEVGAGAPGEPLIEVVAWPPPPGAAARLARLGVAVDGDLLRLGGETYPASEVAAAFRLPEESREPGGPAWHVLGRDLERVAEVVSQVLALEVAAPAGIRTLELKDEEAVDFLVHENPWMRRTGAWLRTQDGWRPDPASGRDGFAERRRWFADLAPAGGERVLLLAPPARGERPEVRRLAAELERAAGEMAVRVPLPPGEGESPDLVALEESYVDQGRHTAEIGPAVPGGPADLHLVFHPDDLYAYRFALAEVLLERAGSSAEAPPWLVRGAALWLAGEWYGRPWREWLPALSAAGARPTAEQLLARDAQRDASAPLWTPWAAAVVEGLPGDTVAGKLRRAPAAGRVAALLEAAEASARADARRNASEAAPAPRWVVPKPGFLRGVSLAMFNNLDGGYHAPSVDRQLDRLASLGADAVSLMPFAFQRDPHLPALGFVHRSPSGETDVGLVHAARRAHARGFTVLWKPHLWVHSGSWSGEVSMRSEADWQTWWESYRRYVLHHAFLAAWTGSELFSVGVEMSGAVHREAEWRRLVADVRRLYPGLVTYSANWYGDLERAGFLDALDLVGVDAYYPLAEDPEATPAELAAGAERVTATLGRVAREHGRPVLLTEVGFPARRAAWVSPHEEGGEASEADQAAAYRALLGALDHQPWLAGAFIWKAFSGEAPFRDGFRFLDRPAEEEIGRWFTSRRPTP